MPILITADIHLSNNPRDAYRHEFMRKLPALAKKHNADAVFILGDFTEEKDAHPAELVNAFIEHLHALAKVAPVVCLQGNHDSLSSADNPFFGFLRRIERLSWIGAPTPTSQLNNLPAGVARSLGRGGILLPHSANPKRDWEGLDFRKYDWAFTHQAFEGATSGFGHKLSGLSLDIFPERMQIVSGDVHVPQEYDNLIYVGSPYLIDFGDLFDPRCLLIEDNGKVRSIPCTGPQKRLVEVRSIAELAEQDQLTEGDILKVRLEITPGQHAEWPELAAKVRAWGADNGFLIHLVQPAVTALEKGSAKTIKAKAAKSDEQLIQEYAKSRGLDERTEKTGLTLL